MCINNKLKTLCFYTLDSDKKVICDDENMSDTIRKEKLSKKTNEELVHGNDYFFVASLEVNKDQVYEIFENLNKSKNTNMKPNLKFDYKCHNNDVECMNLKYDLKVINVHNPQTLNEHTIIDSSNWTSGAYPDVLPASFKEKWSKIVNIELKYRVKKKMKTLKGSDLEFFYKIEKSE